MLLLHSRKCNDNNMLIPNHQSSFCWICLPLLTLSIIRSSCPPSHHWTSLRFHFLSRPLSFLGWTTAMLFWLDFHQTQSNLYKWFRMQQHDWSLTSPKESMLHLSLSPCTGYQLQLASSSRHWCLHIKQPQGQHPPTSTHYYEYTSLPEV